MIVYLDTSVIVPLLIEEPTSEACGELWDGADEVVCSRLVYVEATAALGLANRMGRISVRHVREARTLLSELWSMIHVVELDDSLMVGAAGLAVRHALRGYDATHCAAALSLDDAELVAASADKRLVTAWQEEGIATFSPRR